MKGPIVSAAAVAALAILSQSTQAHVATIDGSYDSCSYDTPCLTFHNTSNFDFTNAQMELKGYQGLNNGLDEIIPLPDILANLDTNVIWDQNFIQPGVLFAQDYDDEYGGTGGVCPPGAISAFYCALRRKLQRHVHGDVERQLDLFAVQPARQRVGRLRGLGRVEQHRAVRGPVLRCP